MLLYSSTPPRLRRRLFNIVEIVKIKFSKWNADISVTSNHVYDDYTTLWIAPFHIHFYILQLIIMFLKGLNTSSPLYFIQHSFLSCHEAILSSSFSFNSSFRFQILFVFRNIFIKANVLKPSVGVSFPQYSKLGTYKIILLLTDNFCVHFGHNQ